MLCFGKKPSVHHCKIVLLDETEFIQEFQDNSDGQQLLDVVFKHLNLMETAYFGLRYLDSSGQRHWLDPSKKIIKQLKGLETFTFYFGVKFYASDPCKLLEEITRYQFFMQVKQDIYQGRLPLTFDLAAELFAYAIQSELGDYDPRRHQPGYPSEFRFTTIQTSDLEAKAAEIHKTLSGRVPAVAELNFLDRVKWLDMYGVDLHPVLGEDSVEYFLGLTPSGILVLRNKTRVGNYFWPRISKVYYKRKYFMVRVRDKNNDENTYGFELPTKQSCKHLWKCCAEHRQFFRLTQVREIPGQSGKVLGLENKFVYSGRPGKNIQISGMQARIRTPPTFTRVPSRRYQKRLGQPDGADAGTTQPKEEPNGAIRHGDSRVSLTVANPPPAMPSLHRSTSVPTVSPTDPYRAAPWEDPNRSTRGLYSSGTNPSPRSVRSAGAAPSRRHLPHQRAGSVDSAASYDYRKRKHHHHHHHHHGSSTRQSDNESEVSKSSRCSKSSRSSRHRRHGSQSGDGSDSDSQHRHRRHCRRKKHGSTYELVNSEGQWREVQKQSEEQSHAKLQSAVVKDLSKHKSGYMNSGLETESEATYSHRRRHRRHRSRSRSPDSKGALPTEVKRYIDYNLVDPSTLTEEEKKDIKYTKVQADSRFFKIRYSPPSGRVEAADQENNNAQSGINQRPKESHYNDNSRGQPMYTHFNGNTYTHSEEHHQNENKSDIRGSSRTLIPKPTLNGFAHSANRSSNNVSFASDLPANSSSSAPFVTDWTQSNRNMTTFDKKPKSTGEQCMMNGNPCRPVSETNHQISTLERISGDDSTGHKISGNIRIVNGHYYPAPKPPPPPRVTFLNEVTYQPYPKILESMSTKAKR